MLPPTLNPGSSPASPVVSTPPHDAPSLPSLPGLPASPQKKLIYDTLKKPFDDQDSSVIIWTQMLKEATLPNVRRKTRLNALQYFLDNEYFDQLINELKSIADWLPEKFVDSFLHPSGSGADPSASLRESMLSSQVTTAKQVRLLFGDADSLDTLEFDETHANYVRRLPSEEHRRTWDEAQTCMEGGLVLLSSSLST
ncbi:uncharacterized protein UDID_16677 [Ustilago sp. UG-2017a]|nr:uncharacterized protein UDID_16677 [Ustilago sp. UG-2017a]